MAGKRKARRIARRTARVGQKRGQTGGVESSIDNRIDQSLAIEDHFVKMVLAFFALSDGIVNSNHTIGFKERHE
jgi:hypothetical protein